jgi:hypothetical protein
MKASHNRIGDITIEFNSQGERLLSPDKTQHLLPCCKCGELHWVNLNVVSVVCYEGCSNSDEVES